jgi:GNAT superfamily N-acetyltransferase
MEFKWLDGKSLSKSELLVIASIDSLVPAEFDPTWLPTTAYIEERVQKLAALGSADFFQVVYNGATIVGFHIINGRQDCIAHISTLWVAPGIRGRGVGRQLKAAGVAWATESGFTHLQTGVHARNQRMHEINLKNGFEQFSTIYRLKLK